MSTAKWFLPYQLGRDLQVLNGLGVKLGKTAGVASAGKEQQTSLVFFKMLVFQSL